jgi:hypothetical protein
MVIGAPSSARIDVRRPTLALAPRRTSPAIRANGSIDRPAPIVGDAPELNVVRGEALMPLTPS